MVGCFWPRHICLMCLITVSYHLFWSDSPGRIVQMCLLIRSLLAQVLLWLVWRLKPTWSCLCFDVHLMINELLFFDAELILIWWLYHIISIIYNAQCRKIMKHIAYIYTHPYILTMDHHMVLTHAPFCLFAVGTAPSGDRREVHVERGESLVELRDCWMEHQIWWVSANMGI